MDPKIVLKFLRHVNKCKSCKSHLTTKKLFAESFENSQGLWNGVVRGQNLADDFMLVCQKDLRFECKQKKILLSLDKTLGNIAKPL